MIPNVGGYVLPKAWRGGMPPYSNPLLFNARPGGSGGGGFSPLSLTGLVLWCDCSDSSTLFQDTAGTTPATANNDPVGRINDKSGNSNNFLQGVAGSKPSVQLAVQNGLNVVDWDGTSDIMATAAFTLDQPFTVFMAATLRAVGNSGANDAVMDGATFASAALLSYNVTSTQMYAGASLVSASQAVFSSFQAATLKWKGASSLLRIDGVQLMTGNAGTQNAGGVTLGALAGGGNRWTQLRLGELIVCNVDSDAGDVTNTETYLMDKWL